MKDERYDKLTEQERSVRSAIRSAGQVRADAAFRERLKREFVSGTIAKPAADSRSSRSRSFMPLAWILLPAAAALVLLAIFLPRSAVPAWSVQAVHGEGVIEIDGQVLATGEPERLAEALAAGGHVRLPDEVGLDVRLGDRLILALNAGSEVTLPALNESDEPGTLIADVHHGEMNIMTGPGFPGTAMHILTSEGRTEITGTIVSVYKADGYTCVCVLEGTAHVGPDESRLEAVSAGHLMVMLEGGVEPIIEKIAPTHEAGLLEFQERNKNAFEGSR
jgi:ferric-dicitrate binding protein FerR (iron transport regulator)